MKKWKRALEIYRFNWSRIKFRQRRNVSNLHANARYIIQDNGET